jgi:hypothetical protein
MLLSKSNNLGTMEISPTIQGHETNIVQIEPFFKPLE